MPVRWRPRCAALRCSTSAFQTMAGKSGTLFPSITGSMSAVTKSLASQGVDISVYNQALADHEIFNAEVDENGAQMQQTEVPLLQGFFSGQHGDSVFAQMQQASQKILGC